MLSRPSGGEFSQSSIISGGGKSKIVSVLAMQHDINAELFSSPIANRSYVVQAKVRRWTEQLP